MYATSISIKDFNTLTIGATLFVVQEAFEITASLKSTAASFTPITTDGMSSSFAGAEIITCFAPPTRCLEAASRVKKRPVDSKTVSTPCSAHGMNSGFRSLIKVIFFPLEKCNSFPLISKDKEKFPWMESYFNKWASVLTSAKSLTKATST